VEAAVYRNQRVYFQVIGPWTTPERSPRPDPYNPVIYAVFLTVLACGALLAGRNLWKGRADVRGALRLGGVIVAVYLLSWVAAGRHFSSFDRESEQAMWSLGRGAVSAVMLGLLYLALEPFVRRRWPWRITAWGRLLGGRWRDPLVGRDLLIGVGCGVAAVVLPHAASLTATLLGAPPPWPWPDGWRPTNDFPSLYSALVSSPHSAVGAPLFQLMFAFILALVLRRPWLSWGAFFVLYAVAPLVARLDLSLPPAAYVPLAAGLALQGTIEVLLLARFGLLALAFAIAVQKILLESPLTTDPSAWYFGYGLTGALIIVALAVYGFVTATRGRRLFREGFFGDE
jgi:serine/threonine-protein kinase